VQNHCDTLLCKALEVSQELIDLAQRGMEGCEHERCLMFFGLVLDAGHKIQRLAVERRQELAVHP